MGSLAVSTRRFGSTEGFVIHHRGDAPELFQNGLSRELNAEVVPVLIVAASREERDRIVRELTRHLAGALPEKTSEHRTLQVAELRIDQDAHRVTVSEREVVLTSLELKLLVTLIERRDTVQARGTLLTDVWQISAKNRTRTVDTHIKRLRDKLGTAGRFLHSVRGAGYRFSETASPKGSYRRGPPLAKVVRSLAG
jgi:DNA-binding winged helix-turn-helix (wHTH) protein